MTAFVLTSEQREPSAKELQRTADLMLRLLAVAEQGGDVRLALNALLGAYVNVGHRAGALSHICEVLEVSAKTIRATLDENAPPGAKVH